MRSYGGRRSADKAGRWVTEVNEMARQAIVGGASRAARVRTTRTALIPASQESRRGRPR